MDQDTRTLWTEERASLEPPELSIIARSMIAARRALHGPLKSELIHDPALDMLLHLFVARGGDRDISPVELAGRTSVAESVARRWIDVLRDYKLVEASDQRVFLTDHGTATVSSTLHAVAQSQWHLDDPA